MRQEKTGRQMGGDACCRDHIYLYWLMGFELDAEETREQEITLSDFGEREARDESCRGDEARLINSGDGNW